MADEFTNSPVIILAIKVFVKADFFYKSIGDAIQFMALILIVSIIVSLISFFIFWLSSYFVAIGFYNKTKGRICLSLIGTILTFTPFWLLRNFLEAFLPEAAFIYGFLILSCIWFYKLPGLVMLTNE